MFAKRHFFLSFRVIEAPWSTHIRDLVGDLVRQETRRGAVHGLFLHACLVPNGLELEELQQRYLEEAPTVAVLVKKISFSSLGKFEFNCLAKVISYI